VRSIARRGRGAPEKGDRRVRTAVVTGASSGIGLEFVRQFLESGSRVAAGSRRAEDSKDLQQLKVEHGDRLLVHCLDVGDEESRVRFLRSASDALDHLDVLVNAAGIIGGDEQEISRFGALDQDELQRTFLINSIAPLMMAEACFPLLKCSGGPMVVNLSSLNGSIARWDRPGKYSYCASKAALNMITKSLSFALRDAGITVVAFHPGWVKTWMTRNEPAPMEPSAAVGGMMRAMKSIGPEESGRFLDWEGKEVPW
jgi:NAD(P)-dependent dehydrogenase (short-subunit alcohol dehydrogenase family)